MPGGTCDPASRGREYDEFVQMQGPVTIYGEYGWDGVSVRPDCDGPVSLLRGTNESPDEMWYVHFQGTSNTWRTLELQPNSVREIIQPELTTLGLANASDLSGLYITQSPNPPQVTFARKR